MAKRVITPAYSPDVTIDFEIPRESGDPIEFTVRRMDYIKDFDVQSIEWSEKRIAPTPVLDDDGKPVIGEDGEPKTTPADPITDREVILAHLKIAGVPAKTLTQLGKLTNGELGSLYEIWTAESKVSVGELRASDS